MINQLDFDDAALLSEDTIAAWEAEFQLMFKGPLAQAEKLQDFLSMSDAERREFLKQEPERGQKMSQHADRMRRYYDGES